MKEESSLNTLTDDDIKTIWLALVVYDNTDQKEVTRLGEYGNGEWGTSVSVTRESNFTRSGDEEVDEAEIFEGSENRLTMDQMYTWEFQCNYQLQRYPFDSQVQDVKENDVETATFSWSQECKIEMTVMRGKNKTVQLLAEQVFPF